jgi:hypothetical protein
VQPYPGQWHQPHPPQAYAPPQPRVHPGVLLGVTVWRLLIVAFALIGAFAALEDLGNPWPGLSLQASLFTAGVYAVLALWPLFTLGRSHEPASSWLRGGTTVLLLLVMIVYLTIMEGDVDETWSLFEHVLTPLIVLVDWVAVGKGAARAKWWHPLTWTVFPLAYLLYLIVSEVDMYGGMFSPDSDEFAGMVSGLLGLTLALGFALYGLGKLRGAFAAQVRQQPQQWPQPGSWQQPHWQQPVQQQPVAPGQHWPPRQ